MSRFRCLAVVSTFATLLVPQTARAQSDVWTIDSGHSAATFQVRHMVIANVKGEFGGPVGTAAFDPKDLSTLRIDAVIDARTINTRNPDRDKDLRSALFFDVAKYPRIMFKSTGAVSQGPGKLRMTGELTMHGITKPVTLDVEGPTPEIKDIWGSRRIGATATATIDRRDFGLVYNRVLEGGGAVVGDQVSITLDIELTRNPAGSKTLPYTRHP
jgi:polyisoprenoid-binding protein YceI